MRMFEDFLYFYRVIWFRRSREILYVQGIRRTPRGFFAREKGLSEWYDIQNGLVRFCRETTELFLAILQTSHSNRSYTIQSACKILVQLAREKRLCSAILPGKQKDSSLLKFPESHRSDRRLSSRKGSYRITITPLLRESFVYLI